MKRLSVFLSMVCLMVPFALSGQVVDVEGSFLEPLQKRDSVLIGDQFRYGFHLKDVPEGTGLGLADISKGLRDSIVVVCPWIADTVKVHGGRKESKSYDIDALRREISNFYQIKGEQLYECWERFNDLLLKCPHHGFETWRLVKYFYDGLIPSNRQLIQSMHGGKFLQLNEGRAWESLESMSESSQHWNCLDSRDRKSQTPKREEFMK